MSRTGGRIDVPELWRLLEKLEDGSLEPAEGVELAALLADSPAARREYLEYFQQTAVLRMEAAKLREMGLLPTKDWVLPRPWSLRRSILAAAALVLFMGVIAALIAVARPKPSRFAATVSADTRWSVDRGARAAGGKPLAVEEGSTVRVASGTVRLETESGDLLVIQGPAEVAFPNTHRPQLRRGWLWIDAGKSEEPFQVETGALTIRDIGTRFGVRVSGGGPIEVHLASGSIEALDSRSGKRLGVMTEARKAYEFSTAGRGDEIPMAPDPFPSLPELLSQASNYRTTVLGQAPAGFWSLDAPTVFPLTNTIPGSAPGMIGQDVRGGEPGPAPKDGFLGFSEGNRSLFLGGDDQRSVLHGIHGQHGVRQREGAVSFWIRREPGTMAKDEILWLAGYGDDVSTIPLRAAIHTRLETSGRVRFEVKNGDGIIRLSSPQNIADGRWHHLAASWGPSSVDLYIDGALAERGAPPSEPAEANLSGRHVRFGKPSEDQIGTSKPYRGWVDGIALWDRPLTETEISCQFGAARGTKKQ